jgi:hypothetical protein
LPSDVCSSLSTAVVCFVLSVVYCSCLLLLSAAYSCCLLPTAAICPLLLRVAWPYPPYNTTKVHFLPTAVCVCVCVRACERVCVCAWPYTSYNTTKVYRLPTVAVCCLLLLSALCYLLSTPAAVYCGVCYYSCRLLPAICISAAFGTVRQIMYSVTSLHLLTACRVLDRADDEDTYILHPHATGSTAIR